MQLPHRFDSAALNDVWAYWRSLPRDGGIVPEWDIVPAARRFPRLIRFISLVEVRAAPPALVFRVGGSALGERLGLELTGRDVFEITTPEEREVRYARYLAVATWPCALQNRGRMTGASGLEVGYEALFLPVRKPGAANPLVLAALIEKPAPDPIHDTIREIPAADLRVYVDIGAGLPDPAP
jgi:hypothetical protein